jgi:hypothetical protein
MAIVKSTEEAEGDILSSIYFLARDQKYNTIKPYHARYDPRGKFPPTNIDSVKYSIVLQDMRPRLHNLQWEKCGFKVVQYEVPLSYEDYKHGVVVQDIHIPKILKVLKSNLKASRVHKLDYMACLAWILQYVP